MDPILKQLEDQKLNLTANARAILDKAKREGRELSHEESQQYDRIDGQLDLVLSQKQRREQELAAKNKPAHLNPPVKGKGDETPTKIIYPGFSIPKMLKGRPERQTALRAGTPEVARSGAAYNAAYLAWLKTGRESLGMSVGKSAKGGYLTSTEMMSELIQALDDEVFMRQISRVLPPLGQAVSLGVPTLDTDPADADWTPEIPASDISEDDSMTFGKRELMPHQLTKLIKVSLKFLRSSVISPESIIDERVRYKFGTTLENAYLTGDGAQQPLGVFTVGTASTGGITTSRDVTASSATAFTGDDVIDWLYHLKGQYQRNCSIIAHRDWVKRARKLKTGDGQYIWEPGLSGTPDTIMGRPYFMSEFAPNTFTASQYVAIAGDFMNGYWIADALTLEMDRLDELFKLKNQVGFLFRLETDGMPVKEECFSRMKLGA